MSFVHNSSFILPINKRYRIYTKPGTYTFVPEMPGATHTVYCWGAGAGANGLATASGGGGGLSGYTGVISTNQTVTVPAATSSTGGAASVGSLCTANGGAAPPGGGQAGSGGTGNICNGGTGLAGSAGGSAGFFGLTQMAQIESITPQTYSTFYTGTVWSSPAMNWQTGFELVDSLGNTVIKFDQSNCPVTTNTTTYGVDMIGNSSSLIKFFSGAYANPTTPAKSGINPGIAGGGSAGANGADGLGGAGLVIIIW